ncbi:catalase [Amycolatopsis benzoatilytica]|uniref:catalase n=1 Tax=Amycolatopsis benzoatilytica TaxID=346045 RepID=UPI000379F6E8|nr:catalase [Amycolatopsis benzoatilytica]
MTEHDAKQDQLDSYRSDPEGSFLTTQQGVRVQHTDDSLSAGARGPTLLEDFHAREKITHFDHERIPERVVHARGAGAYGFFEAYDDSLRDYTTAEFLTSGEKVPVFVRFSTVAGSRGSADTVRDIRGFATKFYTRQGNYDLVGNNIPVFFIQDGIKFPDFVHAVKPEPRDEMPQAASAHDTFWDFVSLQPETLHTVLWLMSDRALPRSYRMMQGFGVHTFRLVNAEGLGTFVKFHWKPVLGTHSLVWDECQKIAGKDPDFNRRDLWDAIEAGQYPEWELGVQLVDESAEHEFAFDLLDPTKIIPEEQAPVQPVGRLVLNRNPDNFFAETEQVAFHTANVVPGIDFTNDPLLQARNFSYLDTQLIRLGGPNFAQLPVNRPVAEVATNQRDGYGQQTVHRSPTSYYRNSLGGGCPAAGGSGAYRHYTEAVSGHKIRERSESFQDHYSQPTLFWNSMSEVEREHIVAAFRFELGKVGDRAIRERTVGHLARVDHDLACRVAAGIGVAAPADLGPHHQDASAALSQLDQPNLTAQSRKAAILAADDVDAVGLRKVLDACADAGVTAEVLSVADGELRPAGDGKALPVDRQLSTMSSVLYDAVVVAGGPGSVDQLSRDGEAVHYVTEAYKHLKPVAAFGSGVDLLRQAGVPVPDTDDTRVSIEQGVVTTASASGALPDEFAASLLATMADHRAWHRRTETVAA